MNKKRFFQKLTIATLALSLLSPASVISLAAEPLSKTQAISIATKNANVNTSSKNYSLQEADYDDGKWEIDFLYQNTKYEYEIHGTTGKILWTEKEITRKKAKSISLKRAKVTSSQAKSWNIKHNDDRGYYQVSFKTRQSRYSLRIQDSDGKVLKYSKKVISKKKKESATSISLEKAKQIAVAHAKGQKSFEGDVNYSKAKLDYDDGRKIYELEFTKNGLEFEYEVDAKTGSILDWDIDWND